MTKRPHAALSAAEIAKALEGADDATRASLIAELRDHRNSGFAKKVLAAAEKRNDVDPHLATRVAAKLGDEGAKAKVAEINAAARTAALDAGRQKTADFLSRIKTVAGKVDALAADYHTFKTAQEGTNAAIWAELATKANSRRKAG